MLEVLRHWPLALAMLALGATIVILVDELLRLTQGHFAYYLDDAYIHMAIARHFSEYGVWGVTPYEFSSSSSSLLWTAALAVVFFVVGPHEAVPAVLNVGLVFATLVCLYLMLRARGLPGLAVAGVLLLAVFLVPLPEMVFTGMEHALHVLLALLFVYLGAQALTGEADAEAPAPRWGLVALAPLLALVRYEGLFAVAVLSGLLLLRRRWQLAALVSAAALLPIAAYGLLSMLHGWYPLPNSVILKGEPPGIATVGDAVRMLVARGVYAQLSDAPYLILLVAVATALFVVRIARSRWPWDAATWGLVIFVPVALLHMQFVASRWFNRYDAYLVAIGLFVVALALGSLVPERLKAAVGRGRGKLVASASTLAVAVGLLVLLAQGGGVFLTQAYGVKQLVERAETGLTIVPLGTKNVYEQQYQMGRFLQRYYQGSVVALNDIGAPTYLADIRLVDLVGLGSMDVAERRRAGRGRLSPEDVDELTRSNGVRIAVVHDGLLQAGDGVDRIPEHWSKVGQWEISENVVAGDYRVSFYAVDPAERAALAANLREFGPELPPDVVQYIPG